MKEQALRLDTLLQSATEGRSSRRDLVKGATALGLGAPMVAALLNASASGASAQSEMTLSFDAGATGGGGGKPNTALINYSYVINGGGQYELDRMVDARLITISADLEEIVGDLAESWELTDTTATFNLRPNAMWHDGTPVTSQDVAFTLNVLTDPAATSRWGAAFSSIAGYEEAQSAPSPTSLSGISTPDNHTLVLELTQVDSGLLSGFYFVNIMPEHLLGEADRATIAEEPFWTEGRVGAGPFKFVQLVEEERIELEAFEDYHLGAPQIKKLNLLFFSSVETSLAAFQEGSSLAAPMTPNDVALIEGTAGAEIVTTPAGVAAIWINTKHESFSDKRVRQAIAYAIDKATISETLFRGFASPVSTEIPYVEWAQPDDANPYDYDPEMATQLLEEAGWAGDETYVLWYYYPDQVTASVMEAIQQYLGAVGINVELRFDDGSGARTQQQQEGTWHMIYGSFGAQPAPSNLTAVWGPPGEAMFTYSSEEFNAEMEGALRTNDRDEQAAHYQAAVKILNEDAPWVWLFDRNNLIAVNTSQLTTGTLPAWGPGHIMYHNHAYDWTVEE